jgi:hypothetical protein
MNVKSSEVERVWKVCENFTLTCRFNWEFSNEEYPSLRAVGSAIRLAAHWLVYMMEEPKLMSRAEELATHPCLP